MLCVRVRGCVRARVYVYCILWTNCHIFTKHGKIWKYVLEGHRDHTLLVLGLRSTASGYKQILCYIAFDVSRNRGRELRCSSRCRISSWRSSLNKLHRPNPFLYLLQYSYLLIGGTFIGFLTSKTFNVATKCGRLRLSLSSLLASTLRS